MFYRSLLIMETGVLSRIRMSSYGKALLFLLPRGGVNFGSTCESHM